MTNHAGSVKSIGEFVEILLSESNYQNTVLPRTPVPLQREMLRRLMLLKEKRRLKSVNELAGEKFTKGSLVELQEDWDGKWTQAHVTKVHWKAPYQAEVEDEE